MKASSINGVNVIINQLLISQVSLKVEDMVSIKKWYDTAGDVLNNIVDGDRLHDVMTQVTT